MKKRLRLSIILVGLFSALTLTISASTDTDYTPRDGDHLHPGLANPRTLILSVSDSARTVVLNPSSVSFNDEADAFPFIDSDTISYVQFATKHRFLLHGDTISYIGYENRASDFRLDRPATVVIFPLKDRNTVSDGWSGHLLQYGAMVLKHVKGVSYTRKAIL